MPRVDLNVPFYEKERAKRLGARWDPESKVWYVPDGVNASAFSRWLPNELQISVRSSSYFIAQSHTHCWRCGDLTRVFGFILPAGHEILETDDESDDGGKWYRHGEPTILHYATELPPAVSGRIQGMTRDYSIDFSKTTGSSYWMNHCEACGMKQGDFQLYCEPDGAFFPMDARAASQIVCNLFSEPFGGCADASYGGHLFDNMRWA